MPDTPDQEQESSWGFDWKPPDPELFEAPLPSFEILDVLGRGGMGTVYKARQTVLDRIVAIKVLPIPEEGVEDHAHFAERFQREATAMARLSHPHIVPLYSFGETDEGQLYFVMECVEGCDLKEYIGSPEVEPEHIILWYMQICEALQYAHDHGIIHRDIKPTNILINQDGDAKVADFGLAKFSISGNETGDSLLTQTNIVVGTPNFIAPEAIEDPRGIDHRADIYALGITLYQTLTGKVPRGIPEMPSKLVEGLDPRWDDIVSKCLMDHPDARYQQARELRSDLESLYHESGEWSIEADSSDNSSTESAKSFGRRDYLGIATAAAAAIAAGVYLMLPEGQVGQDQPERIVIEQADRIVNPGDELLPFRLEIPQRPDAAGTLASWPVEDPEVTKPQAVFEILDDAGDVVEFEIGSSEGASPESGIFLRSEGSIGTWSERPDREIPIPEDLGEIVAIAGNRVSYAALRPDGSAAIWDAETGESESVRPKGKSRFVAIAGFNPGFVFLTDAGEIEIFGTQSVDEPMIPAECRGKSVAIGASGSRIAALTADGTLHVWDSADESVRFRQEKVVDEVIESAAAALRLYPDLIIPVTIWAVMGPEGKLIPTNESIESQSPNLLATQHDLSISPPYLAELPDGNHVLRSGGSWKFSGGWKPEIVPAMQERSRGCFQLALSAERAFGLFDPGTALDLTIEPVEPLPYTEEDIEGINHYVWKGRRVEVQTRKPDWKPDAVSTLLYQLDATYDYLEELVPSQPGFSLPAKLIWREVEAGDQPSTEENFKTGLYKWPQRHLQETLESIEERGAIPQQNVLCLTRTFLPPITSKLDFPGEPGAALGPIESHLDEFLRQVVIESVPIKAVPDEGKSAKEVLAETEQMEARFENDLQLNFDNTVRNPDEGSRYLASMLFHLYREHGEAEFLQRFFGEELPARPVPESAQDGVDNFVVAACFAAKADLIELFEEDWRWPISKEATRAIQTEFGTLPAITLAPPEDADPKLVEWHQNYEEKYRERILVYRNGLDAFQAEYRRALESDAASFQRIGKDAAAKIFSEEAKRVNKNYKGPDPFNASRHRTTDPATQTAIKDLNDRRGNLYRGQLKGGVDRFMGQGGGGILPEWANLWRHQILFTLQNDDQNAQWAFDRIAFEENETLMTRRASFVDPDFENWDVIRWAVEEDATVDVAQPFRAGTWNRYSIEEVPDKKSGRFVWQSMKIEGIRRSAAAKKWTDIHLTVVALLENLITLDCGCGRIGRRTMENLGELKKLENLALRGAEISLEDASGLETISKLKLKSLILTGSTITDAHLIPLLSGSMEKSLEKLVLANTKITDILPLADFRSLKELDISGCEVSASSIAEFKKRRSGCLVVQ